MSPENSRTQVGIELYVCINTVWGTVTYNAQLHTPQYPRLSADKQTQAKTWIFYQPLELWHMSTEWIIYGTVRFSSGMSYRKYSYHKYQCSAQSAVIKLSLCSHFACAITAQANQKQLRNAMEVCNMNITTSSLCYSCCLQWVMFQEDPTHSKYWYKEMRWNW